MSNLEVFQSQMDFLNSNTTFTLFSGGRGSGKSYAGALYAVLMATKYPNCRGLIVANTYNQLRRASMEAVKDVCNKMNLHFKYIPSLSIAEIGETLVDAVSAENYDSAGRGANQGWAWFDEVGYFKPEAFFTFIASIRDMNGPCTIKCTTTPKGFNFLYEFFVEKAGPTKTIIYGNTKQNKFLPDSFYDMLKDAYDDKMLIQETEGGFVNLNSGSVYYGFDRLQNVQEVIRKEHEYIYVGMDFNVNPLTAVFGVIRKDSIYIFDELYLENSNTFQIAQIIKLKYGHGLTIHPDSTGVARKTSSTKTDHVILKDAGFNLAVKQNPPVGDRYNTVNNLLSKRRLIIDPKCVKLIRDLEKLTHENDDPTLSHISDALGYLAWNHFPLKAPRTTNIITNPFLNKKGI